MRCSDARKTLSALLDREGDPAARAAVAAHVDGCAACRGELEALAATDRALERAVAARAQAPAGYHEGLLARIEERLDSSDESADLADVRALADRALERAAGQSGERAVPDILHAPAVLGQVVLPVPQAEPRRRRGILALGTLTVAAAGVAVALLIGGRPEDAAPPPVVATAPAPEPVEEAPPPPPAEPAPAQLVPEPAPVSPPPRVEEKPRRPRDKEQPTAAAEPAPPPGAPERSAQEILEELSRPSPSSPPSAEVTPRNEKLSHDQIKAGMSAVAGKVQACRGEGDARSVVVLRVRIHPDGKVADVAATGAHAGTPVGTCVARKVADATFAPFDGPPMTIKYSYTLEAEE